MIGLIVASKVLFASLLMLVGELVRRWNRPQNAKFAWIAVFLILVSPALISIPIISSLDGQAVSPVLVDERGDVNQLDQNSLPPADVGTTEGHHSSLQSQESETTQEKISASFWSLKVFNVNSISRVLLLISLGGSLVLLWRQFALTRLLGRLVSAAEPVRGQLATHYLAIAREMELAKFPGLAVAEGRFSPFLWHSWFGRSRIVLPVELTRRLSSESVECVLRHELIHFRRRDAIRRRIEFFVSTLWWWFPVIWIARRRLLELEEVIVDAEVVRSAPRFRKSYAAALLDAEEFLSHETALKTIGVPSLTEQRLLKTRIEKIVNGEVEKMNTALNRTCTVALLVVMLPVGMLTAGTYTPPAGNEVQPSNNSAIDNQDQDKKKDRKSKRNKKKQSSEELPYDKETYNSESSEEMKGITLVRRTTNEYGKSAYSFRYRTQEKQKHRNYVDLVYSADGKLRINNHGGMEARIANLGKTDTLKLTPKQLKSARWTNRNLPPEIGKTYAMEIKAYNERRQIEELQVVFRVLNVYPEQIEIAWNPAPENPWPVDNRRFGMAGTSGMNRAARNRR